jgi:signal transduction histidine kinase
MLNYFIATLLTLALVGFLVLSGIKGLSINTMEAQLIDQSKLAEIYISQLHSVGDDAYDSLSVETSQRVISKLGLILGNVRIYDKNLSIQASSKSNMETGISDTENTKVLNSALEGKYAYVVRDNIVYFASPINAQNSSIGILEIISPLSFIENLITEVTRILVVGAAVFTIIIAVLIAFIAGKITKPINLLAAAASNYANRNFIPVTINGTYEISQLSKSFNTMGIQLQDYINRQKLFVANVSHELRTPLTAIKGYSEYLKDEVNDRPDLQKAVYHLNNESERLYKLVEEVLTLSRIDSRGENFDFQKLNFSGIIGETIEKMLLRAEKYSIRIKPKLETNVYVWGDSEKLIQVIINLLDNAFKFSPPESTVDIKLYKENNAAFLSITDQGIGIPKEAADKVFERFYRAQNAQGVSGTGLGLSIVKYIIEAHKGSVELIGDTSIGTTVKIVLPIYTPIE